MAGQLIVVFALAVVAGTTACRKRSGGGSETCEGFLGPGARDERPKVTGPSPACTRPRAPGRPLRRTLNVAGSERVYLVVEPTALAEGERAPVIFVWHGLGGTAERAFDRFAVHLPPRGRALVVYPQALPHPDFGQAGWDLHRDGRDFQFFDRLLDTLAQEYCLDLGRVFATGHSFGGWMTNRLGYLRASRLRAIAPSAGGLSPGDCGGRPLAALILHARNDQVVAFEDGEAARNMWAAAASCKPTNRATTPGPCLAHDGCAAGAPVVFCAHDQHHSWPDFAAEAVWSFFASQR